MVDRLITSQSQVCISIGVTRACGLKVHSCSFRILNSSSNLFSFSFQHAIQSQARHDTRLAYPAQVGINSYARLSLSFLSDMVRRIAMKNDLFGLFFSPGISNNKNDRS